MSELLPWIDRLAGARVAVLGDVMLDRYIYGGVDRISPEAPVLVLRVDPAAERLMPGGAGNVARNVAALGGHAVLIGLTGDDGDGRALEAELRACGGIQPRLVRDPGRPTTCKTRYVAGRQQLLRADSEDGTPVSGRIEQELLDAFRAALADVDAVVLSDYAKGTLSPPVLGAAIAAAQAAHRPVIADPKHRDLARYRGVTVLTPNRQELAVAIAALSAAGAAAAPRAKGDVAVAAAAAEVRAAAGVDAVLVTRSEQGMTLVEDGAAPLHLPAEAREVFDVSGAGDTVVATLALALGAGAPLAMAAQLANVAAGIVVGKAGTAVAYPQEMVHALHRRAIASADAKVLSLQGALDRVAGWRQRGERIGFTNGCFDLIHPGHVMLLAKTRDACDRLIVGINTDDSVKRLKGPTRPIQSEASRALVLAAMASVDLVVPFDDDTPIELIRALRPDVLAKGADYRLDQVVGADLVQAYGGRILLVELEQGHSTTGTLARVERSKVQA